MRLGLGLDLSCPITGNGITPFSPTDISNLELWLDATDAGTINLRDSTYVTDWADKSGQGNDFFQTVAANQPIMGVDEVDFFGSLLYLIAGSNYIFSENDGLTIVALAKTPNRPVAGANMAFSFGWFAGGGGHHYALRMSSNTVGGSAIGMNCPPSNQLTSGDWFTDEAYHRGMGIIDFNNQMTVYKDNVATGTPTGIPLLDNITAANIAENPTRAADKGPMTVGVVSNTASESTYRYLGALKMLLIYTRKLTTQERSDLDTYLAALP